VTQVLPISVLLAASAFAQEPPPEPPAAPAAPEAAPEAPPAPAPAPAQAAPAGDDEVEKLRAEVAKLQAELAAQRQDLAQTKLKMLEGKDLKFDLDGYFRTRTYTFNHMFQSQGEGDAYRDARYITSRLRLQPNVKYKELAKFYMQVDAIDDVVWGDNASLASTALFAGDPSNNGLDGQPEPSIQVSRAWTEITVPVGSIRAGRMSSHWGMGLLANSGDGFDDLFGENHSNTTFDRVMFGTRPIAIGQAITGKDDTNVPFIVAVAVDRLVEDPLIQYYGYQCEQGEPTEIDACDGNKDGIADIDRDYTDDERTADQRGRDWWADQNDDVREDVFAVIYRGLDTKWLGQKGDLVVGGYLIHRVQKETDSDVLIPDLYVDLKNRGVHLQGEVVHIRGDTRAITLPGAVLPGAEGDPLQKQAAIWGYVGKLGYERASWSATFEHGYASGDDNVADARFTGRPLAQDYNVGLLIYEEVLAQATAESWQEAGRGLWSNGSVYNSRYVFPHVTYEPLDNWMLVAAWLHATVDKADGAILTDQGAIGDEIDVALKIKWHDEHALFSLESGFAKVNPDVVPLERIGLNPEGNFFTLQSRLAFQF
jgi:hypothetical protein